MELLEDRVRLTINVGRVQINGRPIKIPRLPFDLEGRFRWVHVLPQTYFSDNLPESTMYCFEDTMDGTQGMYNWLSTQGLIKEFSVAESLHNRIWNYHKGLSATKKKDHHDKIHKQIKDKTDQFIQELANRGLSVYDNPRLDNKLLKKLHEDDQLLDGSILNSSLIYKNPFFDQQPINTNNVRYINNLTFIADLSNNDPVCGDWNNIISSAIVPSGCLRLFSMTNYGGIFLFLWGPNGQYPDLSQFGFDKIASSLQQTP